jgi:hypothetical protein
LTDHEQAGRELLGTSNFPIAKAVSTGQLMCPSSTGVLANTQPRRTRIRSDISRPWCLDVFLARLLL